MRLLLEKDQVFISETELDAAKTDSSDILERANKVLRSQNPTLSVVEELPRTGDSHRFRIAPRGSYLDRKVNLSDIQGFKNPPIHGGVNISDGEGGVKVLGGIQNKMLESLNSSQVVEISPDGIFMGSEKDSQFKTLRDLLNYASKTIKNFDLSSAEMSVTAGDVKFEVKVTK